MYIEERGVSRGMATSVRFSLRVTLLAQLSMPCAVRTAAAVLQGAMVLPREGAGGVHNAAFAAAHALHKLPHEDVSPCRRRAEGEP